MNKTDLINAIAEKAELTKADAGRALEFAEPAGGSEGVRDWQSFRIEWHHDDRHYQRTAIGPRA